MEQHTEQYLSYKNSLVKNKTQAMRQRIINGEAFFLYKSVYLPVDSVIVNENTTPKFSIATLHHLGLQGWEITSVVPKTLGTGLQNSSIGSTMGTTWGGGVGGNVIGVYILLKKIISLSTNVSDEFLEEHISENILEFSTEEETQKMSDILSGKMRKLLLESVS